jgi:hypothetical protein
VTTWELRSIAEEMANRRSAMSPLIERMIEVRDRVNGDVIVPVAEPDDELPLSNLTPLLVADAVEHPAMYATMASPSFTAPVVGTGKRFADYADRRRRAMGHLWEESWMDLVLGRMFRHLAAYATSALIVEPDHELRMPRISTRDPLSAYPEPKAPEDLTLPRNCGFVYGRSQDWLFHHFPQTREWYERGSAFGYGSNESELWDVVEWIDEERIVLAVLGPRDPMGHSWTSDPTRWAKLLTEDPNPIGRCLAVCPRAVTLDRIQSQLANLVGHADLIAKLTYLDVRATEKSVFPDRFVLAKSGQAPRLLTGKWEDGAEGGTNIVVDADQIGELRGTPDPNTKMTLDRVERNFRVSSGLVPQTGGETYGALRTGRGIDSLMGAALDPRAAELHKGASRYLTAVNEIAAEMWASRWPARTYMVAFPGEDEQVEFEPAKHFERTGITRANGRPARATTVRVDWPMPGMDDQTKTVVVGQLLGAGLVSQRRARYMHPAVRNPMGEERRILVEQLEALAQVMLSQRAAPGGGLTPADIAVMVRAAEAGDPLYVAMEKADKAAMERQAAQPPAPEPGQLAAPEAMPGLAMPGEGAEMGGGGGMPPVIEGPPDDITRLNQLVSAMNGPTG